jgi:hypothetical protein
MSQSLREPEALAEGTLISHLLELCDRRCGADRDRHVFLPLVLFSTVLVRPVRSEAAEGRR